jgi:hypothetical protein
MSESVYSIVLSSIFSRCITLAKGKKKKAKTVNNSKKAPTPSKKKGKKK